MGLSSADLRKYWDAANLLRKNLDAAEYKHIVLGLVFLKYISDAFIERQAELSSEFSNPDSPRFKPNEARRIQSLEERDYYTEVNVFWVPSESRWELIRANAKQADIAFKIDKAFFELQKENPKLSVTVVRKYVDFELPTENLGQIVDLIDGISFPKSRQESSDILGEVYEFFLGKFAAQEGTLAGQFFTPRSIVRLLVELIQPTTGRVYDPCCGSGGMFVQSQKFVDAHGGKLGNISIYGQESNPTNRRLAAMNLAIRGIDFDLGSSAADTFEHDLHKDLKFDYILMNPPFGREESYPREKLLNDVRWKRFGVPREKPSNYAWLSHAIHHMSSNGKAAIVMPRISLVAAQGGDDKMRKAFVEANIVEAIIDLPAQLFFNTVIPSCIWVFNQNKSRLPENVKKKILFIDARKMGSDISSTQIEFGDEEIKDIAELHTAWSNGNEANIDGFSYSASIADIEKYSFNLTPAKYVGSDGSDDNELHSDEDFMTLVREIELLSIRGAELDKQIFDRFKRSGYGN